MDGGATKSNKVVIQVESIKPFIMIFSLQFSMLPG